MTFTCYTLTYRSLNLYPCCPSLEARPCCISCRQNTYFSFIRLLIRQKKKFFWIFFIHETADSYMSVVAILSILITFLSSYWRQRLKPFLVRGIGRGGFRNLDYTESYHFASINTHQSVRTIFGILSRAVTAPIPI